MAEIVEFELQILGGVAGHHGLALFDDAGHFVREMDGLATSANGDIKAIGYLPSDQLKFYDFDHQAYYSSTEPQNVLFQGTMDQAQTRWAAANFCGDRINDANLSYPFLGLGDNSNSVASTLTACMALQEGDFADGAWLTPGTGTTLLNTQVTQFAQLFATGAITDLSNAPPTLDYVHVTAHYVDSNGNPISNAQYLIDQQYQADFNQFGNAGWGAELGPGPGDPSAMYTDPEGNPYCAMGDPIVIPQIQIEFTDAGMLEMETSALLGLLTASAPTPVDNNVFNTVDTYVDIGYIDIGPIANPPGACP